MATTGPVLFPGASTFPNTNVYPGQGNLPVIRMLYSTDPLSVNTPSWTDVTSRLVQWSVESCSRQDGRSDFNAGNGTFTIRNDDRLYDPLITAAVGPRNRVWLMEEFSAERQTLFYGYVARLTPNWGPLGFDAAYVTFECEDELGRLAQMKLPAMDPASASSYADLTQMDGAASSWRWAEFTPMRTITQKVVVGEQWHWTGFLTGWLETITQDVDVETSMPGWRIPTSGGGYGVANDTPIVGDFIGSSEDGASGCLIIQATQQALDATSVDDGDVFGTSTGSIEMWLKVAAGSNPAANKDIWYGPTAAANTSFRVWDFIWSTTGTLIFLWTDSNGTTHSLTASSVTRDTWHHVVATNDASNSSQVLYLDGVSVATGAIGAGFSDSNLTGVMGLRGTTTVGYNMDEMAIYPGVALTAAQVSNHYVAGTQRGFPRQTTDARVIAALDAVDSTADRVIMAANSDFYGTPAVAHARNIHPKFMTGQLAIDEIRNAVACEMAHGAFFCDMDGTLRWVSANERGTDPHQTSIATYGDAGGSELQYLSLDAGDYSLDLVVNTVTVKRYGPGGVTKTSQDVTSKNRYGEIRVDITDLPLTENGMSNAVADDLVNTYGNPRVGIVGLEPNMGDAETARVTFSLNPERCITVKQTPPGGGTRPSYTVWIQGISFSGDDSGAPPRCKIAVSA